MKTQMINLNAHLSEAIEVILEGRYRTCIVVDDQNKVVGVLSEGDILRSYKSGRMLQTVIKSLMNPNPIILYERVTLKELISIWVERGIESIPIVNKLGELESIQNLREDLNVQKNEDI